MIRLLYPHGLGDVIQALPAFEAFARARGDTLDVGVLARIPAARDVLAAQPFVGNVFGIEDPWRDFEPRDTWAGYEIGIKAITEKHGGAMLRTAPPRDPLDPAWCKAYRVAQELGVEYAPVHPSLAKLWLHTDAVRARTEIDERGRPIYAVLHGSAGNPSKDVEVSTLGEVARLVGHAGPCFAVPVGSSSIAWHLGFIERAAQFVGVDSGPAHLASCTRTPVAWVFTRTPIEQAVPLFRPVTVVAIGDEAEVLVRRWERWSRANRHMVEHEVNVAIGESHGQVR